MFEIARIGKVNGTDVLELVDARILSRLDAAAVSKLRQDMVDQPGLLKAMGDDPELVESRKVLDDLAMM